MFWSLLAWLPIAVWAVTTGHWIATPGSESLSQHFGVNVRCLVAIPLFIIAEGTSPPLTTNPLPYFETSGLIRAADVPRFHGIIGETARLPLQLVPTHPDGAGGLAFVERFLKAVASARWAHDLMHHEVALESIRTGMISLAILLLLIFLAPGLVWIGKLAQTRQQALLDHGALVASYGDVSGRPWGNVSGSSCGNVSGRPCGKVSGSPCGNVSGKPRGNISGKPCGNICPRPRGLVCGRL